MCASVLKLDNIYCTTHLLITARTTLKLPLPTQVQRYSNYTSVNLDYSPVKTGCNVNFRVCNLYWRLRKLFDWSTKKFFRLSILATFLGLSRPPVFDPGVVCSEQSAGEALGCTLKEANDSCLASTMYSCGLISILYISVLSLCRSCVVASFPVLPTLPFAVGKKGGGRPGTISSHKCIYLCMWMGG